MIIFMNDPKLVNALANKFPGRIPVILNLSSYYSGYIPVTDLITKISPINNTGLPMPEFVNSVQFDIQYMNSVLSNPEMFYNLINIMLRAHEGFLVCILVERDPYRDAVMESLIKLIQQRYGYNCWIAEDIDDIECIAETFFTPAGLLALDQDISVYDDMYSRGVCKQILQNVNIEY